MSLRARMGLGAGVAVALAVIAAAVSAYAGTRSQLRGQVDNSLRSISASIETRAQGGPHHGPSGEVPPQLPPGQGSGDCDLGLGLDGGAPGFGGASGLRQFVSSTGQTCVVGGSTTLPVDGRVREIAASGSGQYFTDVNVSGHHLRVMAVGLPWRGALMVALPLTEVDKTLSSQLLLLAIIAAAGIALAALLGFLVARTAIAPITRFTRQTEAIAAKPELIESERVTVEGTDELARLARTFNTTLDALERSMQSQRNLVADASHELRTPIASIRANLQLLRDEELLSAEDRAALRDDMIQELDELTALVSDVVELARGSKPTGAPGEVRFDEIVGDAVERARRRAPELTIEATLEPTLVHGEGERIARAVSNLLDNARKWSPPGGMIEVELQDGTLSVRDHGPGFHEEDLPFVFDRFHRARDARSKPGSGLGLAIVRQAAEAHGGFAEAANAAGGGALLRLNFGPVLELGEEASEPALGAP
jgi:two-component system sensor histidine kinase MprB